MFSWSTGRHRGSGTGGTTQSAVEDSSYSSRSSYPGNRSSTVATAIRGSIRPPDYSRKQHLDSYIENDMLRRSTRRVSSDDTTYDTVFQTVARNTLILRVHLPSSGSQTPIMTLAGCTATHPWIDSDMKVNGYRPIQSDQQWRDARMLLGVAVQEVIQHFQVQPPTIQAITDAGLRNIQPQESSSTSSSNTASLRQSQSNHQPPLSTLADDAPPDYDTLLQQTTQSPPTPPPPQVDVPAVPTEFSKLEGMEREELEELLKNHVALVAFCNGLPFIRELNEKRLAVLEENVAKAEKNMEKEEELKALHIEVEDLRKDLKARVDEFKKLEAKQDSLCAVPDTSIVLKELNAAKMKSFEDSEQIAEEWLDNGAKDVRDFCRRFIEARKSHHNFAGKVEVLQAQGRKIS